MLLRSEMKPRFDAQGQLICELPTGGEVPFASWVTNHWFHSEDGRVFTGGKTKEPSTTLQDELRRTLMTTLH